MRKIFYLLIWLLCSHCLHAQEILPGISVKNFNGKIIVSWRNQYPLEVKTINIQRSYDSLKNYSTIGTVLAPQNAENGFVDETPPYNKMYYRVFISFDGGDYIFSDAVRPVKDIPPPQPLFTQETIVDPFKKADIAKQPLKEPKKEIGPGKKGKAAPVSKKEKEVISKNNKTKPEPPVKQEVTDTEKEESTGYPSRRIYTGRENNLVISLANADNRKYSIRFYDEGNKFLFELNRVKENYLIIEKVNFMHAGWFYFELFDNGRMIEKNRFYIAKDGKN